MKLENGRSVECKSHPTTKFVNRRRESTLCTEQPSQRYSDRSSNWRVNPTRNVVGGIRGNKWLEVNDSKAWESGTRDE